MLYTCVISFVGGFAFVFVAQDTKTGQEYALKVNRLKSVAPPILQMVRRYMPLAVLPLSRADAVDFDVCCRDCYPAMRTLTRQSSKRSAYSYPYCPRRFIEIYSNRYLGSNGSYFGTDFCSQNIRW